MQPAPVSWIAVNRPALNHNVAAIGKWLKAATPTPRLIAVVKANAYGHGAVPAALLMSVAGVDMFAVTTASEAIELRDAGITSDILVFAPPMPDEAAALIERDIIITVADLESCRLVDETASRMHRKVTVHLKIDTGMGRLGVLNKADLITMAGGLWHDGSQVRLGGVYTHFGRAADGDFSHTRKQYALFQEWLNDLREARIDYGMAHCANSATSLRDQGMWLDAVRIGTMLYGQYPSSSLPRPLTLKDTWQLKTRIVSLRDVPAGTAVGYGAEYVTRKASRLAVLTLGYADGVTMNPASLNSGLRGLKSNLMHAPTMVTIRGAQAPIVGRVSMQMCCVDVTGIEGVHTGDTVIVPCRRLAANSRIPRIYED